MTYWSESCLCMLVYHLIVIKHHTSLKLRLLKLEIIHANSKGQIFLVCLIKTYTQYPHIVWIICDYIPINAVVEDIMTWPFCHFVHHFIFNQDSAFNDFFLSNPLKFLWGIQIQIEIFVKCWILVLHHIMFCSMILNLRNFEFISDYWKKLITMNL